MTWRALHLGGPGAGDRNLAKAAEGTRVHILGEMIRLCGTVRPVIVAPSASGAYLFPFLVQRPLDVGGLLAGLNPRNFLTVCS